MRTITVSSSEVDAYRQCRLKHQLSYIERWRTDEEAEALSRGTLFHSVMEDHYAVLQELHAAGGAGVRPDWLNPEDVATSLYSRVSHHLFDRETGEQTERQELVEWMYRGYVERWGLDTDWEIVGIEIPINQPIGVADGVEYRLSGTCDLVVRDRSAGGGLWIVDHKTCKNLPKRDFDLEDQTAVYAWLLKQSGMDIRGAIYNHCRTYRLVRDMTLDERFKRQITVRSDRELQTSTEEIFELMIEAYARKIEDPNSEYGFRDAPRSPDGERCDWKCNMTEACIVGRKYGPDRTRRFLEDTGFSRRDTKPGPTFNKGVSA